MLNPLFSKAHLLQTFTRAHELLLLLLALTRNCGEILLLLFNGTNAIAHFADVMAQAALLDYV